MMEPEPTPPHRDPLLRSLGLHGEWVFFNSKGYRVPGCLSLHEQPGPTPHRDPFEPEAGSWWGQVGPDPGQGVSPRPWPLNGNGQVASQSVGMMTPSPAPFGSPWQGGRHRWEARGGGSLLPS